MFSLKNRRIIVFLLCILMVFTEAAPFAEAGDNELVEYSPEWYEYYGVDNDLQSFDPDCPEPGTLKGELGYTGENAMTIFYFLIDDMGLHTAAAVGILANIFCESSFRYDALGDNGTSYGICQWHAGRWEKLKSFCDSHGLDWHTLGGQLAYLKYETEQDFPRTMAAIRDTSNDADGAYRSAYLWCKNFEVPADTLAMSDRRGNIARDTFWPLYKDLGHGEPEEEDPPEEEKPEKKVEILPVPEETQPSLSEDDVPEPDEQEPSVLEEDIPEDGIIPEGIWYAGIEDKYYTGKAVTQDFRIYYSDKLLKEKTDYTVSYENNKKVGTAVLIIEFKGNYVGTIRKYYKVMALDISEADAEDIVLQYNGKQQKPKPVCKLNGVNLKYDTDFSVPEYNKNIANGFKGDEKGNLTVSLNLCGMGNYTGTKTIYLTYVGKQTASSNSLPQIMLSKVTAASIPAQTYKDEGFVVESLSMNNLTGKKGKPYVISLKYKGKSLSDNDVQIVGLENADKPGKAYIMVSGCNARKSATGYSFVGIKRIKFNIKGKSIGKLKISGFAKSYAYTGQEITPSVNLSGITGLTANDYVISYKNNIMPGKATILVTGINRYTGTKKATFKITGYAIKDAKVTVYDGNGDPVPENTRVSVSYNKTGAVPEFSVSYNGAELVRDVDYSVKVTNNKAAGTATINIQGKGCYSGSRKIKYKITALDFSDNVRMYAADKSVNKATEDRFIQPVCVTDTHGNPLVQGKDYTAPKYYIVRGKKMYTIQDSDAPRKGDVIYVAITGKGGYSHETVYTKYTIIKGYVDLGTAKVKISIKDQAYTGNEIRITSADQIEFASYKGENLAFNEDYRVVPGSYVSNKEKGTAKVTLKGCGDYIGQKTVSFRINAIVPR